MNYTINELLNIFNEEDLEYSSLEKYNKLKYDVLIEIERDVFKAGKISSLGYKNFSIAFFDSETNCLFSKKFDLDKYTLAYDNQLILK